MDKKAIQSVDEYLNQFQDETKIRLELLRQWVHEICPDSTESISYGMPAYKFLNKPLVYFAGYEKHIGFYATPNTHEAFSNRLKTYKQGKGSVQFPIMQELPEELIKDLIIFRKEYISKQGK
jgi:uncharacterized protein YdhG (YjbR/CyaY superfamily)